MKHLVLIIAAAIIAGSVIDSAYALGGVNATETNGTSPSVNQHLRIDLSSLQIERVELSK